MTSEQITQWSQRAGFGANLRNTHRVKLELFAKMVEVATEQRIRDELNKQFEQLKANP